MKDEGRRYSAPRPQSHHRLERTPGGGVKPVGVLDGAGLVALFRKVEGRRLLGVVDAFGVVELVFDDDRPGGNLICLYCDDGRNTGLVSLGGVADPAGYCERQAA